MRRMCSVTAAVQVKVASVPQKARRAPASPSRKGVETRAQGILFACTIFDYNAFLG